ncbi:MAG: glycosyltransferase family 2 protein [Bacteroidetes bacterium]|nr:glycosyltransferase family 2 protein [Bacteroidota bacterium]
MENPLVTVITVTYNSGKYVRDAIESVLHQNYENIEYIIGDDHSSDDTWEIISSYRDPRIKAYRNPSNLREYPNRNKALEMATGKYVIFIDGDDMVYPHGLRYMVTMLEAFPSSGLLVVGYDKNAFIYPLEFGPEQIYKLQYSGKGFLSASMVGNLFRTQALKDAGGFPTGLVCGDYYVRLKICQRHHCLVIGGNPVWARATPGQASSQVATTKGYLEVVRIDQEFIGASDSPLSEPDKTLATRNVSYPAARKIARSLVTLHWKEARYMMKTLGWTWTDLKTYLSAMPDNSYMSEYNSTHLLRMDLSKNPFSTNYKRISNGSSE